MGREREPEGADRLGDAHVRHLPVKWILEHLGKGIQTPMAQGRSTKIISMIKWIWTIRLSIKNYLSLAVKGASPSCATGT